MGPPKGLSGDRLRWWQLWSATAPAGIVAAIAQPMALTRLDDGGVDARAPGWAKAALEACLLHLPVSRVTESRTVQVLDSWTEGERAFCVVYQYPYFKDGVLGIRCTFDTDMYGDEPSDPEQFGRDVADFDIGEPLGTVANSLRSDLNGIHWWGDLEDDLPRRPSG